MARHEKRFDPIGTMPRYPGGFIWNRWIRLKTGMLS